MTDSPLAAWESFYVIVGSSGAALIGMQFVVITLIADRRTHATGEAISAFATPTVVHLGGALVVSAIMSAPWPSPVAVSIVLALYGLGGFAYAAGVIRRARRQRSYTPVWQDWLWYAVLPCTAYVVLAVAAFRLRARPTAAAFAIGGAALALLLIGIHNAWDSVTHIALGGADTEETKGG
jgi:hypothetical protein